MLLKMMCQCSRQCFQRQHCQRAAAMTQLGSEQRCKTLAPVAAAAKLRTALTLRRKHRLQLYCRRPVQPGAMPPASAALPIQVTQDKRCHTCHSQGAKWQQHGRRQG